MPSPWDTSCSGRSSRALAATRAHERVHVRHDQLWGPLFVPAYLIAGLWARSGDATPISTIRSNVERSRTTSPRRRVHELDASRLLSARAAQNPLPLDLAASCAAD